MKVDAVVMIQSEDGQGRRYAGNILRSDVHRLFEYLVSWSPSVEAFIGEKEAEDLIANCRLALLGDEP